VAVCVCMCVVFVGGCVWLSFMVVVGHMCVTMLVVIVCVSFSLHENGDLVCV